ncbi:MAG: non-reducing end alpha-L-arabinofuranosidase family hydrolase [Polyangiaceae bacterium]
MQHKCLRFSRLVVLCVSSLLVSIVGCSSSDGDSNATAGGGDNAGGSSSAGTSGATAGSTASAGSSASSGTSGGTGAACSFPAEIQWSASAPLIKPISDAKHDILAVKDPTLVRYDDRWHVFVSTVSVSGAYSMAYVNFADFSEASSAPLHYLDQTPGLGGYTAAPEVFYFTPQKKWYLVYQSGPPMYSTTDDLSDPSTWTAPAPFFKSTPAIVTKNGGGWLDYWVICDTVNCHLFFSNNQGIWYHSKTGIEQFPNGFGEPEIALQDSNAGRIFEASNVYRIKGTDQYLALVEAFDQTSSDKRYFRSWISKDLNGPWLPWQASGSFPFAGKSNVKFEGEAWTNDISHGDMIRAGYDEKLEIDPCHLRFMFQGADPNADNGGNYNKIPWQIGVITQTN